MSKHTDILLDAVQQIAGIIYYEMPIKEQDIWLKDIMDKGIWLPEESDNGGTYYLSVDETLKNMDYRRMTSDSYFEE